jgi:hypothetical protein
MAGLHFGENAKFFCSRLARARTSRAGGGEGCIRSIGRGGVAPAHQHNPPRRHHAPNPIKPVGSSRQ